MKCNKCGFENNKKAKFCTKCGNSLVDAIPTSSDNNSRPIIIVLLVVIVLLIAVIGIFAFNSNSDIGLISADSQDQDSQSSQSSDSDESDEESTTSSSGSSSSDTKEWKLIGTYSGSGSGSQSVSVPPGQIMVKLSAYPIKNYATNHLYVTGSNGASGGVDWGSTSAVATRSDSFTYTSSSTETFDIDYYETVSWQVEFYKYE